MSREYQYAKMVQRAGLAFKKAFDLEEGSLCVECPACPQPGRNLPEDWRERADSWVLFYFVLLYHSNPLGIAGSIHLFS